MHKRKAAGALRLVEGNEMLNRYDNVIERIPQGVKKLQGIQNLYLYGNSSYAVEMLNRMKKWNIDIEGVLVSKEYSFEDTFEGYPVYEAEEYIKNCEKPISIVPGFWALKHTDLMENLCKSKKIDRIYIFDGCGYLWCNHFIFPESKIVLTDSYYEGLIKRNLCREYYQENYELFLQTYEWLEDEKSRKTMEAYVKGHIELTEFPMLDVWKQTDVDDQYFPGGVIHLSEEEVFVDCGAYTGDTLESFLSRVNNYKKYYALEPDVRRFSQLKSQINSDKVIHLPVGAWDKKDRLYFSAENACGEINRNAKAGDYIDVDALDHLIAKDDKVSFIKMDIEGAELSALYGAKETIQRNKPKLAICVYHKREDLIAIPQFIKSIAPEYKLYLRAHFPYASELVLYGVCD